jgi:hypothetical protein
MEKDKNSPATFKVKSIKVSPRYLEITKEIDDL